MGFYGDLFVAGDVSFAVSIVTATAAGNVVVSCRGSSAVIGSSTEKICLGTIL